MMKLGIAFGEVHSYYDLNLILSKVEIHPAKPKKIFVDIPGGDGSVDLTEAHGEVKYSDRECKFTFTVLDDESFESKKTEVSNALNGLKCRITLDKDDEFYYLGRCEVSEYLSNKRLCQIVVAATVYPYKFKQNITVLQHKLSEKESDLYVMNARKSVVPEITCTNDNTKVVFGNFEASLSAGTHKILEFQLKHGSNKFTVSGSGSITFKYQEAEL